MLGGTQGTTKWRVAHAPLSLFLALAFELIVLGGAASFLIWCAHDSGAERLHVEVEV